MLALKKFQTSRVALNICINIYICVCAHVILHLSLFKGTWQATKLPTFLR